MNITSQTVLNDQLETQLRDFMNRSQWADHGGIVTDLDGTVVHEDRGRIHLPKSVEFALKELYELGRPLMLNSLRFPLSILRTFATDWYRIANMPIPTVSLNGSQIGFIKQNTRGELLFEELAAFPLSAAEITQVLDRTGTFLQEGLQDLLIFYYPRDWRLGEIIWTPVVEKIPAVRSKYPSASNVIATEFSKLKEEMLVQEICMIFLLLDLPQDKLMAYQHTKRSNFFTRQGVDKLFGSQQLAGALQLDLSHSVGAGDTEMDVFLNGVGLAVIVGGQKLAFNGLSQTVKLRDSAELGDFLFRFATLQREGRS